MGRPCHGHIYGIGVHAHTCTHTNACARTGAHVHKSECTHARARAPTAFADSIQSKSVPELNEALNNPAVRAVLGEGKSLEVLVCVCVCVCGRALAPRACVCMCVRLRACMCAFACENPCAVLLFVRLSARTCACMCVDLWVFVQLFSPS